jgi:hypothetical protein
VKLLEFSFQLWAISTIVWEADYMQAGDFIPVFPINWKSLFNDLQ